LAAPQIVAQLSNHSFKLGENNVDCHAIVCVCNACRSVATRSLDPQPDQLPRRRHSIHYRQQCIQKQFAIACSGILD
jgi:hypothetical protein